MARISHTSQESQKSSNPTTKYLEWKSNDKVFGYYDKATGQNVKLELPFKFLFLEHYHTVKGWNDASESGIWANEVFYIGKEPMTVRAFKGGEIASGLYKDIKAKVQLAGGRYHRSIYVMLEDGSLANISLKGAGVKEWSDFIETNKNLTDNQWIEVNDAKEAKKGSIKYSTPNFTIGKNLTAQQSASADNSARELQTYMNEYFNKDVKQVEVVDAVEVDSLELDF